MLWSSFLGLGPPLSEGGTVISQYEKDWNSIGALPPQPVRMFIESARKLWHAERQFGQVPGSTDVDFTALADHYVKSCSALHLPIRIASLKTT